MSNWTFHPLIAVVPPLVIVYLPSKPLPQSDVLTKDAVGPAAYAALLCNSATVVAARTVARAATVVRISRRRGRAAWVVGSGVADGAAARMGTASRGEERAGSVTRVRWWQSP